MKIGILGAGISGLTMGRLLSKDFNVEVLEQNFQPGGIAKTKNVMGFAYHMVGGHCFNSKYQQVLDFVFNEIMPEDQWHKVTRNAVIRFKGHEVNYPIEFALKQIFTFDRKLAISMAKDLLNANDDGKYANLEVWFNKKFGNTLSEQYFLPYNEKIWNNHPRFMSHDWVEGKLPIPNVESFFLSLIDQSNDKMPHSEFYYPSSNNLNTFIEKLAEGINILYNTKINNIRYDKLESKWILNDKFIYDLIVSTLPLNILPEIIVNCPDEIKKAASKLKYNKVSNMLWETTDTDRTWTYIPERDNFFHRYIHIGNFFEPKVNLTITEVVGERTREEMISNGLKDPFLLKPLDYNVSDHAYVVFDENYKASKFAILDYLKCIGLPIVGRFGEWEYYNMDVCIKRCLELYDCIKDQC